MVEQGQGVSGQEKEAQRATPAQGVMGIAAKSPTPVLNTLLRLLESAPAIELMQVWVDPTWEPMFPYHEVTSGSLFAHEEYSGISFGLDCSCEFVSLEPPDLLQFMGKNFLSLTRLPHFIYRHADFTIILLFLAYFHSLVLSLPLSLLQ